jgi:predicted RNA-binding Zn-ribbon protein involved in translation (DUF1610 family)
MTRRKHVEALAAIVERALDAQPVPRARRLLEVDLAWVEATASAGREALRLRRVIESCRDRHLMELDADEGLTVLGIEWEEVALAVRRRARERAAVARRRCARCGATMELRQPEERAGPALYRCSGCGLTTRAGRRR